MAHPRSSGTIDVLAPSAYPSAAVPTAQGALTGARSIVERSDSIGSGRGGEGAAPRVLVTGGCGFIGHHLVGRLLGAGCRVTVLDDLSTGSLERLEAVRSPRGVERAALRVVTGSVLDRSAVVEASRGIERVYHLASVVGMRAATSMPEAAYRVALEGTRNVLEATPHAPAVLFSSSAVYGLEGANPAREDAPLGEEQTLAYDGGRRGYATGKLHLERLGAEARSSGRAVLTVRPFNVVGSGQSSAYGAVLPSFVRRALAGEPLVVHDDGRQTRAFSDLGVFLDCLQRLVDAPGAWSASDGVFNVGSPQATSILELARTVAAVAGTGVPIEFVPYSSAYPGYRDVRERVPDGSRLTTALGEVSWPRPVEIVRRLCAATGVSPVEG